MDNKIEKKLTPETINNVAKKVVDNLTMGKNSIEFQIKTLSTILSTQMSVDIKRKLAAIKLTDEQFKCYTNNTVAFDTMLTGKCEQLGDNIPFFIKSQFNMSGLTELYYDALSWNWIQITTSTLTPPKGEIYWCLDSSSFSSVTSDKIIKIIHDHYVYSIRHDFNLLGLNSPQLAALK